MIIPVLLYHGINDNPSPLQAATTVKPSEFVKHMDALAEAGCRTLTVSQLVDQLVSGTFESSSAGKFTVLVTFDDGFADFLDALPVMLDRKIASTLFVTSGFVDGTVPKPEEPMLSWSDIPDIHAAGVEIGAHSHTHPQMDTLLAGRAWEELIRPKAMLEDAINAKVRSFAYPHGYNSRRVRYQTRMAGYESGFAVRNAFSHTSDHQYRTARLTVMHDTTLDQVRSWLAGFGAPVAGRFDAVTTRGWRAYRYGRALVTNQPGTVYK